MQWGCSIASSCQATFQPQWVTMHRVALTTRIPWWKKQPTKNTRLVITCCVQHVTPLLGTFREINGEILRRRSAFILFIFPRNSNTKHTNGLCTKGGEKHTEEASESHPSFSCAHAQRSIPSAPRLVRLILRLSWTGRQMWALGLASPQGGDLDLKERSARRRKPGGKKRKTQIPGAWREKTDCLSEAYQSMECYMHSQASEDWY